MDQTNETGLPIEEGKFEKWLKLGSYSPTSIYNYLEAEKRFLKRTNTIILTQEVVNLWVAFANIKSNPLSLAFIKHYLECYDPDNTTGLKINKAKGKKHKAATKDKFLTKEEIDFMVEKLPYPLNLIVKLLFETGLRKQELLNITIKDIDFNNREIKGLGKGNKDFRVSFTQSTALLLQKYCAEREFEDKERLFVFYKNFRADQPYINQPWAFWYVLRKECNKLGFDKMFVHKIRFSLGRFLRKDKGFDLEQVRVKLRHENLNTTQRYSEATFEEIKQKEDEEQVFK